MITTGFVRDIDDLGRIVIPKEILKTLGAMEGDLFEFFRDRDGSIILRKPNEHDGLLEWARDIIKKWGNNVKGVHVDGANIIVITPKSAYKASCTSSGEYNFSIGLAVALAEAYQEKLPYALKK